MSTTERLGTPVMKAIDLDTAFRLPARPPAYRVHSAPRRTGGGPAASAAALRSLQRAFALDY